MGERVQILALADRVEALSGPCRETDKAIQTAIDGYEHADHLSNRPYTASIDAAMSLVPEGYFMSVTDAARKPRANVWKPSVLRDIPPPYVTAATPALALTAASLRAIGEGL